MPGRHPIAVHGVGISHINGRYQMGRYLVAAEVKIDPARCFAANATSEHAGIKIPRRLQIGDRKRQMKSRL